MKKILSWALVGLGGLLLAITVIGHYTTLGDYPSADAREWEAFDITLASELRSWSALSAEAQRRIAKSSGKEAMMLAFYALVTERFTHQAARHTFFSNWLLATLGAAHHTIKHIRDPETMVRRGHSLFCGQSSYVLLKLARENGIRARHVGLDGHVVMEAWYDDDWHLFDPDQEVVPRNAAGEILSVDQLARTPELLHRYYGDHGSMVEIVGSRENNTYMSHPPGAWFEWKSNVLFWFEKLAEYLKFVLPLILAFMGVWLLFLTRRADASSETT